MKQCWWSNMSPTRDDRLGVWGSAISSSIGVILGRFVNSCAILCNFTHLLVHLTAAWKWQICTSLYWLEGLISTFYFFSTFPWLFQKYFPWPFPGHSNSLTFFQVSLICRNPGCRAPSRSHKPLRLAYDSIRLASRLKPASCGFYGGGVSYGGLRQTGE